MIEWQEKPKVPKSDLASMGVYVFSKRALVRWLADDRRDFGGDVIPAMLAGDARVFGYRFEGYWQDVGTIQSYWEANMALLDDHPELDLYDREWLIHTRSEERAPAKVGPTAQVHRSMISHGCVINGTVVNSVLSPGVRVDVGAVVRDSIVMFDTVIRTGAVVDRAILDKEIVVGQGALVGDGPDFDTPNRQEPGRLNTGITVVGKQSVIPRGTRLGRNVKVGERVRSTDFPAKVVQVRRDGRAPGEHRPPQGRPRPGGPDDARGGGRLGFRRRTRQAAAGVRARAYVTPSGRLPAMSIAPRASACAPADVEAWLAELGLTPMERADREGVTSWDLVLDGTRRARLRVTLILDPALALICWGHYAPPIADAFRKSYRRLLRWNDELPFVKFSVGEDERPCSLVEIPIAPRARRPGHRAGPRGRRRGPPPRGDGPLAQGGGLARGPAVARPAWTARGSGSWPATRRSSGSCWSRSRRPTWPTGRAADVPSGPA